MIPSGWMQGITNKISFHAALEGGGGFPSREFRGHSRASSSRDSSFLLSRGVLGGPHPVDLGNPDSLCNDKYIFNKNLC
jgi:hypothetical protein